MLYKLLLIITFEVHQWANSEPGLNWIIIKYIKQCLAQPQ